LATSSPFFALTIATAEGSSPRVDLDVGTLLGVFKELEMLRVLDAVTDRDNSPFASRYVSYRE